MKQGIDFTGVVVCNLCHDGQGNYVLGLRSDKCRDEHFTWEPAGSGGVKFAQPLEDAVRAGADVIEIQNLGVHESMREVDGVLSHWVYIVNKVQVNRDQVIIGEPEKCVEQKWCPKDSFPEPLMSQFPSILKKFYEKL